jgi:hypothetical protein
MSKKTPTTNPMFTLNTAQSREIIRSLPTQTRFFKQMIDDNEPPEFIGRRDALLQVFEHPAQLQEAVSWHVDGITETLWGMDFQFLHNICDGAELDESEFGVNLFYGKEDEAEGLPEVWGIPSSCMLKPSRYWIGGPTLPKNLTQTVLDLARADAKNEKLVDIDKGYFAGFIWQKLCTDEKLDRVRLLVHEIGDADHSTLSQLAKQIRKRRSELIWLINSPVGIESRPKSTRRPPEHLELSINSLASQPINWIIGFSIGVLRSNSTPKVWCESHKNTEFVLISNESMRG